jgi:signal transduction histidine kinase
MKEEFISSVSHELRTPLTAIKSFTEILLQYGREDEASQKEFLTIIARETDRLIDLINDLLDVSKLSNPEFRLDLEPVDMTQVVKESLRGLAVLAAEKKIQIDQHLDPENRFVLGDKKRLVQVMVNLVGNAIKFSPESGKIEIRTEKLSGKRRRDAGDFLLVAVKDNGIGIPREAQRTIFEKFTQITSRTEAKPHGSGLGLHICKQIVEKLGGNIWVESEVGKGSTFYFTVPLAEGRGERDDEKLGTQ